jgi:hypothetical protein
MGHYNKTPAIIVQIKHKNLNALIRRVYYISYLSPLSKSCRRPDKNQLKNLSVELANSLSIQNNKLPPVIWTSINLIKLN